MKNAKDVKEHLARLTDTSLERWQERYASPDSRTRNKSKRDKLTRQRLQQRSPNYGYLSASSQLLPHNVEQAKVDFVGLTFEVETGFNKIHDWVHQ